MGNEAIKPARRKGDEADAAAARLEADSRRLERCRYRLGRQAQHADSAEAAMNLRSQLIAEEGCRSTAYLDTLGIATIGIGHTGPEVHLGLTWTDAQIDAQLDADISTKRNQVVDALPWFEGLNEPRQAVIMQMAFQLGTKGLLGFPNTLAAVHDGRYTEAGDGMLASKWAQQTPNRVHRLAQQMATGQWVVA